MEKKENVERQTSSLVKKKMFLRKAITEIERTKQLAPSSVNRLKNIFSKKKFNGIEKCCYEIVIALGRSGNTTLKTLAIEFNNTLNNSKK